MKSAIWLKNSRSTAATSSGTWVSSMAAVISSIHRSRSFTPMLKGMCRPLSRGCPRSWMYRSEPPNR